MMTISFEVVYNPMSTHNDSCLHIKSYKCSKNICIPFFKSVVLFFVIVKPNLRISIPFRLSLGINPVDILQWAYFQGRIFP